MTYDKAKYHLDGSFPPELPDEQAYVHEGMFLGWLCNNAFLSNEFREDFEDEISRFERGELKCGPFFRLVGGVLADDMLSEKIVCFMAFYYGEQMRYFVDYMSVFSEYPTAYHVEDNSENFRRLSDRLSDRLDEWQNGRSDLCHEKPDAG